MTFKTPSASQYIGSLIIASVLCVIAYYALTSLGASDIAYFLTVGLILGHLVGTFSTRGSSTRSSAAAKSTKTAAASDKLTSLYVGNLAYRAQRENLHELFSQYGNVNSVRIMTDRNTRKPRGYGFVEMESAGAQQAISELDNKEFCGRPMRVSEAKQHAAE